MATEDKKSEEAKKDKDKETTRVLVDGKERRKLSLKLMLIYFLLLAAGIFIGIVFKLALG